MNSKNSQEFIPLDSNDRLNKDINNKNNTNNSYYNPSRRKNDNRASTYGMNFNHDALIGEYGGCPWRIQNKRYSKGVFGRVSFFFLTKATFFEFTLFCITFSLDNLNSNEMH